MGDLPFLVVHGAWVWKAIVLVFALLGPALYLLIRRRRAARLLAAVAPAVTGRTTPTDALRDGAPAVLRGRLRAAGAGPAAATLAVRPEPGIAEQTVQATARAADLALEVGELRIDLDGPAWVLVGSREQLQERALPPLPGLLGPATAQLATAYPWVLSDRMVQGKVIGEASILEVADGDDVFVAGIAHSRPGVAPTGGYRDLAGRWQLTGTEERRLVLAAAGPARARFRGTGQGIATALTSGALAGLMSVWITGKLALDCAGHEPRVDGALADGDALAIAAAMPSREDALARLQEAVHRGRDDTRNAAERQAGLARLRGDCGRQAEPYEARRQWERAAELRRACGPAHSGELVANLLQRGDVAGAAAIAAEHRDQVPDTLAFDAFLLDKRWRLAAEAAAALAARADRSRTWEQRWTCVAQAAAAKAGDASALDSLRTAATRSREFACASLLLDVLPAGDRAPEADAWVDRLHDSGALAVEAVDPMLGQMLMLLALEAEPARLIDVEPALLRAWRAGSDLVEPFRRPFTEPHWAMAPHVLAAADRAGPSAETAAGRARFTELAAMVDLLGGDRDRAGVLADRAEALWRPIDPARLHALSISSDVDLLRASIAYRGGDMLEPRFDYLGDHLALRGGRPVKGGATLLGQLDEEREERLRAALAQAAAGDAAALAAELRVQSHYGFRDWIFALAPRVQHHPSAAALAELVTWSEGDADTLPPVATRLYRAAGYRDLFALLGDRDEAARWRTIADAHMRLFRDRELVVFLQVAGR